MMVLFAEECSQKARPQATLVSHHERPRSISRHREFTYRDLNPHHWESPVRLEWLQCSASPIQSLSSIPPGPPTARLEFRFRHWMKLSQSQTGSLD